MKTNSLLSLTALFLSLAGSLSAQPARFPVDQAKGVNPETHLVLTFTSAPTLGTSGQIRIYDAADNKLVDTLDLSIPASPPRGGGRAGAPGFGSGGPRAGGSGGSANAAAVAAAGGGTAGSAARPPFIYTYAPTTATNANTVPGTPSSSLPATPATAQLTIIGGFSDAFHFYPIIIHGNTATIYPHNNLLSYNKTYYVQIDPGVLTLADGSFTGISGNSGWTFATKASPPPAGSPRLVVAADGSGDFNTVQGAVDFIPDNTPNRTTIFIKNGFYEEIVYFRNRTNITFLGEERDKVIVGYTNDDVFNHSPAGYTSTQLPGTFPYRRASFLADNSSGLQFVNMTFQNPSTGGQAESLLLMGGHNILSHVVLRGHTDTLQFNDSVYVQDSFIEGGGDFIWGRGPLFFENCSVRGLGGAAFIWARSTAATHGFAFLNCSFDMENPNGNSSLIARNPVGYPNSECVFINSKIGNMNPLGWRLDGDTSNVHYWEYNSTNISDGKPYDVSARQPATKQLTKEQDAETIANYSNPTFVLGGWTPTMAPIILSQPAATSAPAGQTATLTTSVAAVPSATYQWLFNGQPLFDGNGVSGATTKTLTLSNISAARAGKYSVTATNASGSVTSDSVSLTLSAAGR